MRSKVLWVLLFLLGPWSSTAAADNRFVVRAPSGSAALQQLCLTLGCNVAGGLDGSLGKLFLVTAPSLVDPNAFLQLLRSQPGITNVEPDSILKVMQAAASAPPSSLYDTIPVNYFGVTVWHGYAGQPATTIIRLPDVQSAYGVTGAGIVAVIDTGVDPTQPVLQSILPGSASPQSILVAGYDFTRNIPGSASELNDVNQSSVGVSTSPAYVNQSSMAIVDQTSALNFQQPQYAAFGHGTMVAGIIHLVAPTAQIMPLKAFSANGSGYLSDILRAIYFAVQNGASVINMSFSFYGYSEELGRATKFATTHQLICVASAGNDGKEEYVYPAAYAAVMGIASTSNNDTLSSFSNYGNDLVWVAAPGEGIVTTYPFGTYAAGWGTSFSTAMVSGAAALLLSVRNTCNESCAERSLAHAVPISSAVGNGRVDVYQAVAAMRQTQGPN